MSTAIKTQSNGRSRPMPSRPHSLRVARPPHAATPESVIEHAALGPGLHLAPFLHGYRDGGFAILAIDGDGALAGILNVEAGHSDLMLDVYTGRGPVAHFGEADHAVRSKLITQFGRS